MYIVYIYIFEPLGTWGGKIGDKKILSNDFSNGNCVIGGGDRGWLVSEWVQINSQSCTVRAQHEPTPPLLGAHAALDHI